MSATSKYRNVAKGHARVTVAPRSVGDIGHELTVSNVKLEEHPLLVVFWGFAPPNDFFVFTSIVTQTVNSE